MRRKLLIASLTVIFLVVVAIGIAVWLINDEDFLKNRLTHYAHEYTGRELAVTGPLDLSLGRETTIEAHGISFSNAPWAENPEMVRIGRVKVALDIPSLFDDFPYLPYFLLEDCSIELLKNEAGEANWEILPESEKTDPDPTGKQGILPFVLNELSIDNCELILDGPERTQVLDIRIDHAGYSQPVGDRVEPEVAGSINGANLTVDGWLAPASTLIHGGALRHELNFQAGDVSLQSSGTIADLATLSEPDVEGHFRGPDIGKLLADYSLPPISEGSFDFRAGIMTREGEVEIDIDGDLGSLDIMVDGRMDKLLEPRTGEVSTTVTGPDLRAIGRALGIEGLVHGPFSFQKDVRFENNLILIDQALLKTDNDSLAVSGSLSRPEKFADSDLDLVFESSDIGQWLPMAGKDEKVLGAFNLAGNAAVDPEGLLTVDLLASDEHNELSVNGVVGFINGPLEPAINGHFQGPDIAQILADYSLPPLSEGAFDFRASVVTRDEAVHIDIDGDLGNLDILTEGTLDNLLSPSQGQAHTKITGPNLRAFGQALGIEDLVEEPFSWESELRVEKDAVQVDRLVINTGRDRVAVTGTLSTLENLVGSDLVLTVDSEEIGRWAPLFGSNVQELGALALEGDAIVEHTGILNIDARLTHGQSELNTQGVLGPVTGPLEPDMDFEFRSGDMPRLASLIGFQGFPASPFSLKGHVHKTGQVINLSNLELTLNRSSVTASGQLSLAQDFTGSEINADINIPDVADFGLLFGLEDLPQEHLQIGGTAKVENGGLVFKVDKGSIGDIRLALDGRVADLDKPLGIDARFDVYLPGLRFLSAWLPDITFPEGPLEVQGQLMNQHDRIGLDGIRLHLGEIETVIDGYFTPDSHFDITVETSGPDVAALNGLIGVEFQPSPFSTSARLAGNPEAFGLSNLDLNIGKSQVKGALNLELGEVKRISGHLVSPYLNVSPWASEEEIVEEPEPETASRYIFDDTPVARVHDLGVEIDVDLNIDELEFGNARYDKLEVGLLLLGDRLEIAPFSVTGVRGGKIQGGLVLDSSGELPMLDIDLQAVDMKVEMGAKAGQDPSTLPTGNLELELHGVGRTQREMASSFDGIIRLNVGPGQLVSSNYGFLTGDFATQLFSTLNPYAEKSEYTELDCVVAAADIVSGQVDLKPIVVNTRQLTIISQGKIDLDNEKLNVTFNTKQRKGLGISATDLVNPFIKVGGTMVSPSLELDPAGTVVKGGIAVATVGLSIIASSLADRYLSSKDPCGDALMEIEKRDGSGR